MARLHARLPIKSPHGTLAVTRRVGAPASTRRLGKMDGNRRGQTAGACSRVEQQDE